MNKSIFAAALLFAGSLLSNAAQAQIDDLTTWNSTGSVTTTPSSAELIVNSGTEGNATLTKSVDLLAGDTISFNWNWTYRAQLDDFSPYNPFAQFVINGYMYNESRFSSIPMLYTNYNGDGSIDSSSGWWDFNYTVSAYDSGPATFSFLVTNMGFNSLSESFKITDFKVVSAVPEPETYALMATGLLGLLFSRKKKVAVQAAA